VGNRVQNNLFAYCPHSAIIPQGNDHLIELNEFHHIGTETADVGAIHPSRDWTSQGNVIRYNLFHDITRTNGATDPSFTQAIEVDDHASGYYIFGNIFYNTDRGILIGGGRDNIIENNVFADIGPRESIRIGQRPPELETYDLLTKMPYQNQRWSQRYPKLANILNERPDQPRGNQLLRNIHFGTNIWVAFEPSEVKQLVTQVSNFTSGDPLFVDYPQRNFQLRTNSPVLSEGWKEIPADRIGPRRVVISPEQSTLQYTARNLPSGASFDPQTRTFTWVPETNQIGVHSDITFQATDGITTVEEAISLVVAPPRGSDQFPPAAPMNVEATPNSAGQIILSWQDNSDDESGFVIERSLDGQTYQAIRTTLPDVVNYSDGALFPSARYSYRLAAVNSAGFSEYSDVVSATARQAPIVEAPTGLLAVGGERVVELSWSPVTGAQGYLVWRAMAPGGSFTLVAGSIPSTQFRDRTVTNGVEYYYFVTAAKGKRQSLRSNQASAIPFAPRPVSLVPLGSRWNYWAVPAPPNDGWKDQSYDESLWRTGLAELGFGDGDEVTDLSEGFGSNTGLITTYFRHQFTLKSLPASGHLTLWLKRDDGAVVYLNGLEIHRSNLPAGLIRPETLAVMTLMEPQESMFSTFRVPATALAPGTNTVSVEVHQSTPSSTDLSFDLGLIMHETEEDAAAIHITAGPYLQLPLPTGATLRWRTETPCSSRIRYGTAPGSLTNFLTDATLTTEHCFSIRSLLPNTRYYYELGTLEGFFAGDGYDYFETSPGAGMIDPVRVWVVSSSGTNSTVGQQVRDAYLNYAGQNTADMLLMLGDNAYESGGHSELQSAFFDRYPTILQNTFVWSALGESDTAGTLAPAIDLPYFAIFNFPMNGEAGGVSSGTENYYSFNYGGIHFVCLDSVISNRREGAAMADWLREDLAMVRSEWLVAFWHFPPYSKGECDSDLDRPSIEMRSQILPLLEAAGVDLVLTGHSPGYQRSWLIDGHYGAAGTFTPAMKKDAGDGRLGGRGPYRKPTGLVGRSGTVYVTVGSDTSLRSDFGTHPTTCAKSPGAGSLLLDLRNKQLDLTYIDANGNIGDQFSIVKEPLALRAPEPLVAMVASALGNQIHLKWMDVATNETAFRIERSTNSIGFLEIARMGANVTEYSDSSVRSGQQYLYRIRASNGWGDSPYTASEWTEAGSLIKSGSAWKYWDGGAIEGTNWTTTAFDDSGWRVGGGEFGYGDGDEARVVGYGPSELQKHSTTYLRGAFVVENPQMYKSLTFWLKRDDGAVIYLNGRELYRSNMPTGVIGPNTEALSAVYEPDEATFHPTTFDAPLLQTGTNVVSVEIHQFDPASSDVSFDLRLIGNW
jgi:hypothetical protein